VRARIDGRWYALEPLWRVCLAANDARV